jgi:hypothetical protein
VNGHAGSGFDLLAQTRGEIRRDRALHQSLQADALEPGLFGWVAGLKSVDLPGPLLER